MFRLFVFVIVACIVVAILAIVSDSNAAPTLTITKAPTSTAGCLIYQSGMCPSESDDPSHVEALDYGTGLDGNAAAAEALAQLVEHITPDTTIAPVVDVSRETSAPNLDPGDGSRWDQLAQCEAGGNWSTNTGNGFGGGLQFMHQRSYSTWLSFGGGEFAPHPWEASREQQIVIAERVLASSGYGAWPGCSRKFGWL